MQLEGYLKGLAKALGGDQAAAEIARILRPPKTLNHKYKPRKETWVTELNDLRYNLFDFDDFCIDTPSNFKQQISTETNDRA